MTLHTLIRRSLRFHWRSHLGVVIGAAIGSAALIGALIVGDSVKGSLRAHALERLAGAHLVMSTGDRFFDADLLERMRQQGSNNAVMASSSPVVRTISWGGHGRGHGAAALYLAGSSFNPQSGTRANKIHVFGVNAEFLLRTNDITPGTVLLNQGLMRQLAVKSGDEIVIRIAQSTSLSGDMAMAHRESKSVALRLKVAESSSPRLNFGLRSSQLPPLNAFIRGDQLGEALNLKSRANLMVLGPAVAWRRPNVVDIVRDRMRDGFRSGGALLGVGAQADDDETLSIVNDYLEENWRLSDLETEVRSLPESNGVEFNSSRVFLDPPLARSALATAPDAQPLLTYLANLITVGSNATPYSMVTAAGAPWTPPDLRDDEIVLNQWLADDLHAKPGDSLTLVYFDPESGARLTERTNTFRVHSIVPMQMPWADRTPMPQFPGIEKAETTAEWDTAFPLVHKIRPQDDDYWRDHRGTPKAFITLAAGQKMWANRFGNLTAIRFPIPTNDVAQASQPAGSGGIPAASSEHRAGMTGEPAAKDGRATEAETFRAALEKKILATLKPEELGLRFEPVREQALKAVEQSQDFGGLFIGFSLFVIVAALLLMAMLFQFSLEQRAAEIGTLLALGFTPKQVRRLFLREGAALAFIGGLIGTLGGIAYARVMLHGLTTIWRDAVGASTLKFFITPQTLAIGLFASTLVAVFTLWLALRKQARRPARELLVGEDGGGSREDGVAKRGRGTVVGTVAFIAAVGLVGWTLANGDTANAGAFFGAGALVLVAGLAFANWRLRPLAVPFGVPALAGPLSDPNPASDRLKPGLQAAPTLATLALRGLTRRRSRSVATAAMLASGTFLIVSIGVFRLDANRDATQRSSGTGGFALIGESTMPIVADLNTKPGRETFALNETDFADVNFVQFRVRAGDEASCLNLNRAQKPRLLAVKTNAMTGRFTFTKLMADTSVKTSAWSLLSKTSVPDRAPVELDEIPAIGDAASIQWAMGKKVGDTLNYVDERGQPFKVRIVGAVANSILQGQLIIDEAEFVKRFPGESGYKYFLIDAPTNRVADVSAKLSRALQDAGLELTPAPQRLAQFNAVQNTYLGTFQILGGLGLLLGSAGLGIVVLRNVLERRGELAVLLAVGWLRQQVRRLVLVEHAALLGAGLALGIAAAFVAVLPSLLVPGGEFPWLTLGLTLATVLANGMVWTWLATRVALRGELLAALRGE